MNLEERTALHNYIRRGFKTPKQAAAKKAEKLDTHHLRTINPTNLPDGSGIKRDQKKLKRYRDFVAGHKAAKKLPGNVIPIGA